MLLPRLIKFNLLTGQHGTVCSAQITPVLLEGVSPTKWAINIGAKKQKRFFTPLIKPVGSGSQTAEEIFLLTN